LRLNDLRISVSNNHHAKCRVNETWIYDIAVFFFFFFFFFLIRMHKIFYIKFHAGRLLSNVIAKVLSVLTLIFIEEI
jgi:hypothetical protein